jgi:hypothetical protein
MISEIPESCVQCVEVALKLGLLIRDLLVLLRSEQLRKSIIQSTEVILKVLTLSSVAPGLYHQLRCQKAC